MTSWFEEVLRADRSIRDRLVRHSVYWVVFILLAALVCMHAWGTFGAALGGTLLYSVTQYIPATYLLLYFVLPQLMRGRYDRFVVRLVIWLGVSFALRYAFSYGQFIALASPALADSPLRTLFDGHFMVTNSFVIVAASLKLFRHWYQQEQMRRQLAEETLSVELQFLKAQVHPHFLFNTLNNIYSLTLRQSDRAGQAVQTLASLMRYMNHVHATALVNLGGEVDLLRNYIELEQLRYGHRLTVTVRIRGELTNQRIAPLLLLPFVENAFKHGASEQTSGATIDLTVSVVDDTLTFALINSVDATNGSRPTKPGGLGLSNVRKRLHLLYSDRHTLSIRPEADRYAVTLLISLAAAGDVTSTAFGSQVPRFASTPEPV